MPALLFEKRKWQEPWIYRCTEISSISLIWTSLARDQATTSPSLSSKFRIPTPCNHIYNINTDPFQTYYSRCGLLAPFSVTSNSSQSLSTSTLSLRNSSMASLVLRILRHPLNRRKQLQEIKRVRKYMQAKRQSTVAVINTVKRSQCFSA